MDHLNIEAGTSLANKYISCSYEYICTTRTCFTLIGSWEDGKNFRVGIFLNKNMLG